MNDSADPNVGASTSGALSAYLAPVLERRDIVLDASQVAALGRLERLHDEFAEFVRARRSLLRRWFNPPIPPRGVYLWGGVGRGKSFLMDAFYAAVPLRRKTRVHFHAFMKSVHDELRTLKHAVEARGLKASRRAGGVVWFGFATFGGGPRSQADYRELARRFAVVIVSDVPRLSADMSNAARRFTWLVDVLYDHRVKLLLSAEVPVTQLYLDGANSQDFARTVSRLIEMRTREYMALPHQAGEGTSVAEVVS